MIAPLACDSDMTHFEPIVRERYPDTWQYVINALADAKGVERLAPETVETLRASIYVETIADGGAKVTLYTTGYGVGGLPTQANVRSGTVFGPASELTGTLAVPPIGSVSLGVPVDNTVGTLTSDSASVAAAVWDTLVADLDTANSIGARLAQAATVPSTGAQIAALGV